MSTKISLKHHFEEGGAGFHLYREGFDLDDEFVYLKVDGVPFETTSSISLSGSGPGSATIRLPDKWARKLGLISDSDRESDSRRTAVTCELSASAIPARATVTLDEGLVRIAQQFTGIEDKSALLNVALTALVEREATKRLTALGGTMPDLQRIPRRRMQRK
jgi:Arc/MetJ family transcription regulator